MGHANTLTDNTCSRQQETGGGKGGLKEEAWHGTGVKGRHRLQPCECDCQPDKIHGAAQTKLILPMFTGNVKEQNRTLDKQKSNTVDLRIQSAAIQLPYHIHKAVQGIRSTAAKFTHRLDAILKSFGCSSHQFSKIQKVMCNLSKLMVLKPP